MGSIISGIGSTIDSAFAGLPAIDGGNAVDPLGLFTPGGALNPNSSSTTVAGAPPTPAPITAYTPTNYTKTFLGTNTGVGGNMIASLNSPHASVLALATPIKPPPSAQSHGGQNLNQQNGVSDQQQRLNQQWQQLKGNKLGLNFATMDTDRLGDPLWLRNFDAGGGKNLLAALRAKHAQTPNTALSQKNDFTVANNNTTNSNSGDAMMNTLTSNLKNKKAWASNIGGAG